MPQFAVDEKEKINKMPNCFENLIDNPSFEASSPLGTSVSQPFVLINEGETISGGWYNTGGTVDLMDNNFQRDLSPVVSAQEGTIWLGFHGGQKPIEPAEDGSVPPAEGFATRLNSPLQPGAEYTFTFWAATTKFGLSWPWINIYLSEDLNNLSNDQIDNYKLIEDFKIKSKDWARYSIKFTADKPYTQIMIYHTETKGYAAIDNLRLNRFIPGCCSNNLVPHGGFEGPGPYGGWKSLWSDHDNKATNKQLTEEDNNSEGFDDFISPVDDVHNPETSNRNWALIRSYHDWIFIQKRNASLTTKLTTPMEIGKRYIISFYGATRTRYIFPWSFIGRSIINFKLSITSYFPTDLGESDDSAENDDYVDIIHGGTPVFENFKLEGETRKWHYYETEFIADQAYEYVIIQAVGGEHPAIDDVCISSLEDTSAGESGKWLEAFLEVSMSTNETKKKWLEPFLHNQLVQ